LTRKSSGPNKAAPQGRAVWKQESDYHQRSLAETGMFRLKKIFGPGLLARHLKCQQTEVRLRCVALNRMTALGMPDSYPVGLAWCHPHSNLWHRSPFRPSYPDLCNKAR